MSLNKNIWMVGDVQGCCEPLSRLLQAAEIASDPDCQLWFAGDLVNRGPHSVDTLRMVKALGERAVSVLGNHDLHLLAVAAGVKKPSRSDTIADILQAPDADELIHWLRHRPLAYFEHNHLLVHAGVLAKWELDEVMTLAAEVEAALRAPNWKRNLQKMYGNEPRNWDDGLGTGKRLRVIINALTRIRMCDADGNMEFAHKGAPISGKGLIPWYDVPGRATRSETIVFGHWSTLGLLIRPDVICLDTGCVWGGQLTAMRMHDHLKVQIACAQYQRPD